MWFYAWHCNLKSNGKPLCELYFYQIKESLLCLYWLASSCRSHWQIAANLISIPSSWRSLEFQQRFKSSSHRTLVCFEPDKAPLLLPWKTCHPGWAQKMTFKTGKGILNYFPTISCLECSYGLPRVVWEWVCMCVVIQNVEFLNLWLLFRIQLQLKRQCKSATTNPNWRIITRSLIQWNGERGHFSFMFH